MVPAVLLVLGWLAPESAWAEPAGDQGISTNIRVKLERDGRLSVTEQITVPGDGPVSRTVELRQAAADNAERVFTIRDARVAGPGEVHVDEDTLSLTLQPGESTLTYSVEGAVTPAGDVQDVRWQVTGGWDVPVAEAEVSSFVTPAVPKAINCLAGPIGSDSQCDSFEIGHTQSVRAEKAGLRPGERVDLSVQLPAGTVPPNARIERNSGFFGAFALTPASGAGVTGVGLLLLGGFGILWYVRGRDARALASDTGPVDVLMTDEHGNVTFASPDGVLPGQVGTVVDEYVDVVDVTATVIDLAVRNYLWIEEIRGEQHAQDWRLVRLNPPDDSLRPFERAVYEQLLGDADEVRISELRTGAAVDLTRVRDALYADVVEQNWFARRPDSERSKFWWAAVGLALAGVALTVVLALTSALALVGLAVAVGGVALTFAARLMPARTRRGSALVAQVRGLRAYLHGARADAIPEANREMVFSRSLPYAVVLGETDRWLGEFADLDPGADGTPGLYWYGEYAERTGPVAPDLRHFQAHFPLLVAAMDSALARAGQVRALS